MVVPSTSTAVAGVGASLIAVVPGGRTMVVPSTSITVVSGISLVAGCSVVAAI